MHDLEKASREEYQAYGSRHGRIEEFVCTTGTTCIYNNTNYCFTYSNNIKISTKIRTIDDQISVIELMQLRKVMKEVVTDTYIAWNKMSHA